MTCFEAVAFTEYYQSSAGDEVHIQTYKWQTTCFLISGIFNYHCNVYRHLNGNSNTYSVNIFWDRAYGIYFVIQNTQSLFILWWYWPAAFRCQDLARKQKKVWFPSSCIFQNSCFISDNHWWWFELTTTRSAIRRHSAAFKVSNQLCVLLSLTYSQLGGPGFRCLPMHFVSVFVEGDGKCPSLLPICKHFVQQSWELPMKLSF